MNGLNQSLIASFVVRLYCDQDGAGRADSCWRVVVRHVQTGQERQFRTLAEAWSYVEEMAKAADPLGTASNGL